MNESVNTECKEEVEREVEKMRRRKKLEEGESAKLVVRWNLEEERERER